MTSLDFFRALAVPLGLFLLTGLPARAETDAGVLLGLSLDDLLDIEVTSVAKKRQKISASAAAIHVISADDIRRSGAGHLGDLLRQVPGLDVARLNSYDWLISARGTDNGVYPNKLLVLIDGRSVYNQQLSTVFWDVADTPLELIERIEIIRGPGGTLWGANAVNGVINIITKTAADSLGRELVAQGGDHERRGLFRYGAKVGADSAYRLYAQSRFVSDFGGGLHSDARELHQAGFRFDSEAAGQLTVQAHAYAGSAGDIHWSTYAPGTEILSGANLLGRWQQAFSDDADLSVQAYYDYSWREKPIYAVDNQVFDFEAQHRRRTNNRHEWLFGLNYRRLFSDVPDTSQISRTPLTRRDNLFSAFIQDEIILAPETLNLIVGSKFEHNDYTGFNYQPNVRLLWTPAADLTLWGALSRAVRTPSQVAHHIHLDMDVPAALNPFYPIPILNTVRGNPEIGDESILALEAGARGRANANLSWDIALFYNRYREITASLDIPQPDLANGRILLYSTYENALSGTTYGAELALAWQQGPWRAKFTYRWLKMRWDLDPAFLAAIESVAISEENPEHRATFQTELKLGPAWQANLALRYAGEFGSSQISATPAYTAVDANLIWQARKNLEITFAGQNLFDPGHSEFGRSSYYPHVTEIPRQFYIQARFLF